MRLRAQLPVRKEKKISRILRESIFMAARGLSRILGRRKEVQTDGSLCFSKSLEAMHKRPIECSHVNAVTESTVVVKRRDETIIGYRFQDSKGKSVAADSTPSELTFRIAGASRQNEQGVRNVCSILMRKLNHEGAHWQSCIDLTKHSSGDPEVDCELSDGHNILKIQVTRAHTPPSFWKTLGRYQESSDALTPEFAAEILKESISAKARKCTKSQRRSLVIALDATETPSHTFDPVINCFAERYSNGVGSLGYGSIWLVGPNITLTRRLDQQE